MSYTKLQSRLQWVSGRRAQQPLDRFYRIQQVEDLGAGPPLQISVPTAREDRLSGRLVCLLHQVPSNSASRFSLQGLNWI